MDSSVEKCLLDPAHSPAPGLDSLISPQVEIGAPITVYSRRETDESYRGVLSREEDLRIVNCPDDLQWIVQCFKGGQWRNKSFHRSRQSLIQRYGPLKMILALPAHHDSFEDERRCRICGRIEGKPKVGLARHLFCLADREATMIPAPVRSREHKTGREKEVTYPTARLASKTPSGRV
jgi:hypothetical protein